VGLFAMPDSIQPRNRKLSDEAKQLEAAGQFAQAADLYMQVSATVGHGLQLRHIIQ
jgi:hypothetical protein